MAVPFIVFCALLLFVSFTGLFICLRKVREKRWYFTVFYLCFLFKLLSILVVNIGLFDGRLEHPDSSFYLNIVGEIRAGKHVHESIQPSHFLNALFTIFGDRIIAAEMTNALLASFALLFVSLCARELFGPFSGKVCSLLILFDPAFNYWTVQLLKESVTLFCLSAAVLIFLRWKSCLQIVVLPLIFFVLHVHSRSYFSFILLTMMLLISFFEKHQRILRTIAFGIMWFFILFSFISPALSWLDKNTATAFDGQSADISDSDEDIQAALKSPEYGSLTLLDRLALMIDETRRGNRLSHRSFFDASSVNTRFNSGLDLIVFLPEAVFYAILPPFPWHAKNTFELLFSVSTVYWYALIPFVACGLFFARSNRRAYVLSGFSIGLLLIISYFVATIAPFVRWRLSALILLYPFAAFALDKLTECGQKRAKDRKLSVAVLGTRGIPARYGGFETFAERLGIGLVKKGVDVSVYCPSGTDERGMYEGVERSYIPDYERALGAFGTVIYDLHCIIHSSFGRCDVIYMLGYSSSVFCWIPRIFGKEVCINMDGLEWKRPKWGGLARFYLLFTEWFATLSASTLIVDSDELVKYYKKRYFVESNFISYGADIRFDSDSACLKRFGVAKKDFYLVISRLEPENNVAMIIDGFLDSKSERKLLIVGPFDNAHGSWLKMRYESKSVIFAGGIFDDSLTDSLRLNCFAYFHGHSVGGTNPSLLSAAGCGCRIMAFDTVFNREVLKEYGLYFDSGRTVSECIRTVESRNTNAIDPDEVRMIISDRYSWESCVDSHILLFDRIVRKSYKQHIKS